MDKYEHQFRNDNYDIIRGMPKEKPCSLGDQSCDSFYSELEKWYSSGVAIDVQDLHNLPTNIVDGLELSDIHLVEQYILEKEEMETWEVEEYFVELSDKQEIDKEMVVLPDMPQKTFCEQEECVEMKTCNMSLPNLFKAKEMVHRDEKELAVLEINEVEIKELPREIKLEKPIELDKSKIHPKWKKVLTSRAVKRVNLTGLEKGKTCRPPPKPPDRENSLSLRHETKKGRVRPYENKKESQETQKIDRELNCRTIPMLPYILNANGEVIGILENIVP